MKDNELEISIRPIAPMGNLYGFAAIKVQGIKIDDFKIVKSKDGNLFVGMPSKRDKTSDTGYRNTVTIDKDYQADFNATILRKYDSVMGRQLAVAEKQRPASEEQPSPVEKTPRIAEQLKKAEREAATHNAETQTPEKAKVQAKAARDGR